MDAENKKRNETAVKNYNSWTPGKRRCPINLPTTFFGKKNKRKKDAPSIYQPFFWKKKWKKETKKHDYIRHIDCMTHSYFFILNILLIFHS